MIFVEILAGFLAGITGSMGMGGGIFLIPILVLVLGFEQSLSQGINLLCFLVVAIISLFIHNKNGFLEMEGVFLIVITGIVFSIFGAFLAGCIDDQILRICFGAFLCFLGCFQLYNVIKPNKNGLQK